MHTDAGPPDAWSDIDHRVDPGPPQAGLSRAHHRRRGPPRLPHRWVGVLRRWIRQARRDPEGQLRCRYTAIGFRPARRPRQCSRRARPITPSASWRSTGSGFEQMTVVIAERPQRRQRLVYVLRHPDYPYHLPSARYRRGVRSGSPSSSTTSRSSSRCTAERRLGRSAQLLAGGSNQVLAGRVAAFRRARLPHRHRPRRDAARAARPGPRQPGQPCALRGEPRLELCRVCAASAREALQRTTNGLVTGDIRADPGLVATRTAGTWPRLTFRPSDPIHTGGSLRYRMWNRMGQAAMYRRHRQRGCRLTAAYLLRPAARSPCRGRQPDRRARPYPLPRSRRRQRRRRRLRVPGSQRPHLPHAVPVVRRSRSPPGDRHVDVGARDDGSGLEYAGARGFGGLFRPGRP